MPEMRAIVELCRRMRTVAEIAALLKMPLGWSACSSAISRTRERSVCTEPVTAPDSLTALCWKGC